MVATTRPSSTRSWLLLALALTVAALSGWLLLGGGLQLLLGRFVPPSVPGEVGQPAPDFTLEASDGQPISLADYRGKVVLINFWATWCPPCQAEMPELEQTYQAHREGGFEVLAVNVQESAVEVQPFLTGLGLTFPAPLDRDGAVVRRYAVRGLPSSYLIDRAGVVRFVRVGPVTRDLLEEQLTRAGL